MLHCLYICIASSPSFSCNCFKKKKEENLSHNNENIIVFISFIMVSELIQELSMASPSSHHLPLTFPSVLPPVGVKLDRSNYVLWKSQVLPIVQAYDLEGFLFGTKTHPSESLGDSANPDFVHWHRLDQFLLSWLLLTITESMLGHVLHCHTSYAVWKTLEQLFSNKSKA